MSRRYSEAEFSKLPRRRGGVVVSSRVGALIRAAASAPCAPLTLTLTGQLISGKNRVGIRRDGHHYPRKAFLNWRAAMHVQILEQVPCLRPATSAPVSLACGYHPGDDKVRDVSGQLDALFSLLVHTKILTDDGLVYNVTWHRFPVSDRPRVVLEIGAYP